jgi:hypothetical protein
MSTATTAVLTNTVRHTRRWIVVALLVAVAVAGATIGIIASSGHSKPAASVRVLPSGPMYMGGHAERRPPLTQVAPSPQPEPQTPGARP